MTQPDGDRITTDASEATTADALEARVVAFAEQLGRIVGTVQAKTEGWLDPQALKKQIVSVRDGAADLLAQLGGESAKTPANQPAASPRRAQGRSGGVVDAPGKKHRKPTPSDPKVKTARRQAAGLRAAAPTVNANRRRGRG
jgi:hypothetical protein